MKERIYGYETEYALIISHDQDTQASPKRMRIYDYLERLISTTVKIIPAVYRKKGIFMENGGLFNYEALHSNFLEGLLEMATPECSNPREVALYHTAQNHLLYDMAMKMNRDMGDFIPGFTGKIVIGKSNVDAEGKCISSHESYLVDDEPDPISRMALCVIAPLFWLINLIITGLSYLPFIIHLVLLMIFSFLVSTTCQLLSRNPRYAALSDKISTYVYNNLLDEDMLLTHIVRFQGNLSHLIFFPFVHLFSFLVTPLVFQRFRKDLISFLVTRTIFSGSGKVELQDAESVPDNRVKPAASIFRISQRSEAIKALCRIFFDDPKRPIIDLRDILLDPLTALQKKKRLHILMSDTNMSSIGVYLKCGITGLVLEMIEEGISFEEVQLRDPLAALKAVSHDISLREKLPLLNGREASALDIQKYYYTKAREYFGEKYPDDSMVKDILEKWEFVLNSLEINPYLLYKKIDWITKKDLIEEVLRGRSSIAELAEVSEWVSYIEKNTLSYLTEQISSPEKMKSVLGSEVFRKFQDFLFIKGIDFQEFMKRWELYHEILKVDFKFHELNEDGYYYRLLQSGLVDELFSPEEVAWATVTPPATTRAHIRGELIKKYGQKYTLDSQEEYPPENYFTRVKIGWNKFYTHWPWKKVSFNEPFSTDMSAIERELHFLHGLEQDDQ